MNSEKEKINIYRILNLIVSEAERIDAPHIVLTKLLNRILDTTNNLKPNISSILWTLVSTYCFPLEMFLFDKENAINCQAIISGILKNEPSLMKEFLERLKRRVDCCRHNDRYIVYDIPITEENILAGTIYCHQR